MSSTHNHPSHLDQNGRSFNSLSHSVTGSFSSTHTRFSDFLSQPLHLSVLLFLQTLVLFPPLSLLSPLLSAKTSHQSRWLVSNCSAGSILPCFVWRDQNNQHEYGKTASMVISSPVISISVKLTWLNLTYIQTDGDALLQSPLGLESHCKYWLCLMCINIPTRQGCWLSAVVELCSESNNLLPICFFLAPSPPADVKCLHLGVTPPYTTQGCWLCGKAVLRSFFCKVSNFNLLKVELNYSLVLGLQCC